MASIFEKMIPLLYTDAFCALLCAPPNFITNVESAPTRIPSFRDTIDIHPNSLKQQKNTWHGRRSLATGDVATHSPSPLVLRRAYQFRFNLSKHSFLTAQPETTFFLFCGFEALWGLCGALGIISFVTQFDDAPVRPIARRIRTHGRKTPLGLGTALLVRGSGFRHILCVQSNCFILCVFS